MLRGCDGRAGAGAAADRCGGPAPAADRAAGEHGSIRMRRALIIMASASGMPVPAIARLVAADENTVRGVIHCF